MQPTYTPFLGRKGNVFSEPILEEGDKVRNYSSIVELSNALFTRLSNHTVGELKPITCLLRIPGYNNYCEILKQDKQWKPGVTETALDQRSGPLRFFEQRQVHNFYRDIHY